VAYLLLPLGWLLAGTKVLCDHGGYVHRGVRICDHSPDQWRTCLVVCCLCSIRRAGLRVDQGATHAGEHVRVLCGPTVGSASDIEGSYTNISPCRCRQA
jgi:hypothetical protein